MYIRKERQERTTITKKVPTVVLCHSGCVIIRGRENRKLFGIERGKKYYVTLHGSAGTDRIGFCFGDSPRETSIPVTPSETDKMKFSAQGLIAETEISKKHTAIGGHFMPKHGSYDCTFDEAAGIWYFELKKCPYFTCGICYPPL